MAIVAGRSTKSLERTVGIAVMLWAPVVMFLVSAAYFMTDRQSSNGGRVLASASGVIGATLFIGAFIVGMADPRGYRPNWQLPYLLLYTVPVALIPIAFVRYRGNRLIHLLQLPNIVALAWACFFGAMAITGEWL